MTAYDAFRPLIPAWIEGELDTDQVLRLEEHLEVCADCRRTAEALRAVREAGRTLSRLEPPDDLAARLTASSCARWLDLLHRAADHELESDTVSRLLQHMETCPGCRRAWDDLTLIHQIRDALTPPPGLALRCIARREGRGSERRIFGVRTATAAAYVLAVLTTLLLGNPVSLARRDAGVVHQARRTVERRVAVAASNGRGELRVILWRTWKWGQHQAESIRDLIAGPQDDDTAAPKKGREQGEER